MSFERPFKLSEYEDRMNKVKEAMIQRDIEVFIVNNLKNNYYLTGNLIDNAPQSLIIWEGAPINICRYHDEAAARPTSLVENWAVYRDEGPIIPYDPIGVTAEVLREYKLGNKKMGFELNQLSFPQYERLSNLLPDAKITDAGGIVEGLRVIKSDKEIEYMRKASEICEKTVQATIESLETGKTENDVLLETFDAYLTYGGEYPLGSYPFMLQFGPHGDWPDIFFFGSEARTLQEGDAVFIEIGAFVKRYPGTRGRTVCMGEPSKAIEEIADATVRGLNRAIEEIKPGVTSGDVDKACRSETAKSEYGNYHRQRTGYSIGIDWSEGDIISIREGDATVLKPGMTFHIFPAFIGIGTIGTSENILVTEDGCEVLGPGILERKLYIK